VSQKSPTKKKTVYLYCILIKWADFFLITEDSLKFLFVHQQLTETFEIQHLQLRYEIWPFSQVLLLTAKHKKFPQIIEIAHFLEFFLLIVLAKKLPIFIDK
jgi:hypothetical protein